MGISPLPGGLSSWLVGGAIKAMLATISSAISAAAAAALRDTATMLNSTTSPGLLGSWFSVTYWRIAALSALLTLPFLFAAAIHALVRSDITLLGRAVFGYLPLATLGVTLAAPLTTLLLASTDEMCAIVAGAAGHADGAALGRAAATVIGVSAATGSPMLGFFIALLALLATIGLWIELLIRAAAVDVIVLMLPLFFAAMVWPARRVWAIRAIETLIALILSKFAIIAVLTLGATALGGPVSSVSQPLVGATLVVLAVLSPWALLRLLPLHELAAAAAGGLSHGPRAALQSAGGAWLNGMRSDEGDHQPDAGAPGLSAEDDGDAALARTVAFGMSDRARDRAANGLIRTGTGGVRAEGAEDPALPPDSAAGLRAVERAGHPATEVGDDEEAAGSQRLPVSSLLAAGARAPGDDRPPINAVFAPGEWEPMVLGDEGEEVMQTPRFVSHEVEVPTEGQRTRDLDASEER